MMQRDEINRLVESGEYAQAEEQIRQSVDTNPEEVEAKVMLGKILALQGKYDDAITILSEVCSQDAGSFEAFLYLGIAREAQKKYDDAIAAFKGALKFGQDTFVHYLLGRIYNDYRYHGRSEASARYHLRIATSDEQPVEGAFIELSKVETLERAIYVLQNGLRRYPKSLEMYESLGWYLYRLENYVGCIEAVESAFQHQVQSDELCFVVALAHLRLKDYQQAIMYEFKGQGTEARKITREIAAMLNTYQGGIVFYGIDDDGNIEGSDIPQQKLDQPLQNSIRNSISPAATIRLHTVQVMGNGIIVIIVPPWNKKDVYQFDEKILIRKGTNVFAAKPEEVRRLYSGKHII